MQVFKATATKAEDSNVKDLAKKLLAANAAASQADADKKEAKEGIAAWLKEQRGFDIDTLKAGESILIQVVEKDGSIVDACRLDAAERPKMVASGQKNLCLFYKPCAGANS